MRFLRLLSILLLLLPLSAMSTDAQKISSLAANDTASLVKQRQVLERYLGDERSRQNYKTVAGKLGLLRALLDQKIFKPTQSYEYGCMGVVLGDAFAQELKMEWVVVEDAQGRDLALRLPNTSVLIFPIGMILKRVMRGEAVDVFDLFNGVAASRRVAGIRCVRLRLGK